VDIHGSGVHQCDFLHIINPSMLVFAVLEQFNPFAVVILLGTVDITDSDIARHQRWEIDLSPESPTTSPTLQVLVVILDFRADGRHFSPLTSTLNLEA